MADFKGGSRDFTPDTEPGEPEIGANWAFLSDESTHFVKIGHISNMLDKLFSAAAFKNCFSLFLF